MYVILFLFVLVFLCSLILFYSKDSKEGFEADMADILPISITPDNNTISVPNTVQGNKGTTITFGGDLIASKNSHIKGSQIVDNGMTVTGIINTENLYTRGHDALAPIGSIMSFVGKTDPPGWVICDGQARTDDGRYNTLIDLLIGKKENGNYYPPDLTNRFLKGSATMKETNTPPMITLTNNELPAHSHTGITDYMNKNWEHNHGITDPGHSHAWNYGTDGDDFATREGTDSREFTLAPHGKNFISNPIAASSTGISINNKDINHQHTFTTNPTGSGQAFPVPPPLYYGISFIIKY